MSFIDVSDDHSMNLTIIVEISVLQLLNKHFINRGSQKKENIFSLSSYFLKKFSSKYLFLNPAFVYVAIPLEFKAD